jgi:plasmid stabilization system protein ParE
MSREVLLAVVVTLIVNEVTEVSPWTAIRLVRWAAKHIHASNTERAAQRAEEWEALIDESIPTKISKLFFGLGFGCAGLYYIAMRRAPAARATLWRLIRRFCRSAVETVEQRVLAFVLVAVDELPLLQWLMVVGGLLVLMGCGAGLARVREHVKSAAELRRLNGVTP